ncbi:MAG: tripartite tricarboxylate transporter substrate binding protein [Burkholderiaceae bacterium]
MSFKVILSAVALTTAWAAAPAAHAQAQYPERPVQVVVPYVAGGPTDIAARFVSEQLSKRLKQSFVVQNRGGAGGNIGAEVVARSAPDGYNLLVIGAAHAINKSLYKKLSYDIQRDFVPVALLSTAPMVLLANPQFPASNVQQLVDYARKNPGRLNYASQGNGTAPHLTTELLKVKTGVQMVHVPYKGSAQSLADMVAGQVPVGFDSVVVGKQYSDSGRLKALAVTTRQRSPVLPGVPTMAESGFPSVEASVWYAVVAPAGTPAAIVNMLNQQINEILNDPAARSTLLALGAEPAPMSTQAFDKFLRDEIAKWAEIVAASGAQVD